MRKKSIWIKNNVRYKNAKFVYSNVFPCHGPYWKLIHKWIKTRIINTHIHTYTQKHAKRLNILSSIFIDASLDGGSQRLCFDNLQPRNSFQWDAFDFNWSIQYRRLGYICFHHRFVFDFRLIRNHQIKNHRHDIKWYR